MKTVINPKYQQLESFIKHIPYFFDKEGEPIYMVRNQLKRYQIEGYDIIVKSFKKPHFLNRIVYTFFRPSKAKRSYDFAFKLLNNGVGTPQPIAYIEEKKGGLLNNSYYISIFEKEFKHIRDEMMGIYSDDLFIKQLVEFITQLHKKGILFMDLSPGNLLFKKENGIIHFKLIDINRVKFTEEIPLEKRFKNFERLSENEQVIIKIAKEYAQLNSLDINKTISEIIFYISKYSKNYAATTD